MAGQTTPDEGQYYGYRFRQPRDVRLATRLHLDILLFLIVAPVAMSILDLYCSTLKGSVSCTATKGDGSVAGGLMFFYLLIDSVLGLRNVSPSFIVKEGGLSVEVFWMWHVRVPWANIVAIEPHDFWWTVKADKLTLFHRLVALGKEPYFRIHRGQPETPALVAYICRKCGIDPAGVVPELMGE